MATLGVFSIAYLAIIAWLAVESAVLAKAAAKVPLRIGVTGTRGKSSVTRLIAAALRGEGLRVVAKTTGSKPVIGHADGTEETVVRTAPPRIVEQSRVVKAASAERADASVVEIMAVHPDNQAVESRRILRLNVCVITNARVDHESEQGSSADEVAAALASSVPPGGLVVCGHGADLAPIAEAAARAGAKLRTAPAAIPDGLRSIIPALGYEEFEQNVATALEVCAALGFDRASALRSMAEVVPDSGALRSWSWTWPGGAATTLWNGFAANDVESSLAVLGRARSIPDDTRPVVAIVSLRADRPERTRQWIGAIGGGALGAVAGLKIIGPGAGAASAWLRRLGISCEAMSWRGAGRFVGALAAEYPEGALIVGLGNIAGPGEELVEWCERKAEPYGR